MSRDHGLDAPRCPELTQPMAGYDSSPRNHFTSTGDCRHTCAHVQYRCEHASEAVGEYRGGGVKL
jgi:hypothetical protein